MQEGIFNFTKKRVEKIVADLLIGECEDLAEFFEDDERFNSFVDLFGGEFDERKVSEWIMESMIELKSGQLNRPEAKRRFVCPVEQMKQSAEKYITKEAEELLALEIRLKDMVGIILREVCRPARDNSAELNPEKGENIIEWKPRKK